MHKTRKLLHIFFLVLLLVFIPSPICAAEEMAAVEFVASAPDSNSNFILTMTISNATFNAYQFVIRYNSNCLQPVDKDTKFATYNFDRFSQMNPVLKDSFSYVGNKLNHQLGMFEFTNYLNQGSTFTFDAPLENNLASIGPTGLGVYEFHFKLLNTENFYLEIATVDGRLPYNETFDEGWALALGSYRVSGTINFDLSALDKENEVNEYINPISSPSESSGISNPEQKPPENQNELIIKRPTTSLERLTDTLVMQIGNYAAAKDGVLCHIYPGEKLVTPYIKDQRTFVPIRFIAEKLGMEVTWNDSTKTVTYTKGSDVLTLSIGEKQYQKNGVTYSIDTAAELQWSRTMVPIRFVAEALGYAVEWNPQLNMVYITKSELPWLLEDPIERQATNDVALVISPLLRDFV